ncbi:MAG: tRNA (adenosine(37)-N6)-dimethylallyltransferase MiaA [Salinimicrobium sp.]
MPENTLIVIVGPTAIGKTSLSLALAEHFSTEIISADSRQFFKEMSIGTAAPTREELAVAPHHFIHHKSIEEDYSVGDFEREALERLEQLFQKHEQVVMVGGSGLYVDAVTKGLDKFPEVDASVREQLNNDLQEKGIADLQQRLQQLDPEYYSEVDLQNPHRLIRALEICIGTGKPYSYFRKNKTTKRPFRSLQIGLTADRETVYDRINRRVDIMMEEGLLEEAKRLYSKKDLNALNTVGYKEIFRYLDGEWSLEHAVAEIKKNSRRFAKRQFTWFRKNEEISWFDYDTPPQEIINFLKKELSGY